MKHHCIHCGTEQGFVGKISTYIYCERCGAKLYADGSVSYDATTEGIEQQKENERFYDSGYSDRDKWKRSI